MTLPDQNDPAKFQPLLTYAQTGTALNVTARTVQTLVKTGKLSAVRFGQTVRIDPADLRKFIDSAKRGGVAAGTCAPIANTRPNPAHLRPESPEPP